MTMWLIFVLVTIPNVFGYRCPNGEQQLNLNAELGTPTFPILDNLGPIVSNSLENEGIVLKLSDNNITDIDPSIFSDDVFKLVVELDLSSNSLVDLPVGVFDNFRCVRRLSIANNKLQSVPEDLLVKLRNLKIFDLRYNFLKELPSDLFKTTRVLSKMQLSHNNISIIGDTTFHEELNYLESVDLSHNQLKSYEPWPYIPNVGQKIKLKFDLTHNQIAKFTNHMGWIKTRSYLDTLQVDLRFNALVFFREEMYAQYIQQKEVTAYDIGDFALDLRENPWFCDCGMYYAIQITNNSFFKFMALNYLTCNSPEELAGKPLGHFFTYPDKLICNITEDCPSKCKCEARPHQGHVVVNCSGSGLYTSLPERVPSGNLYLDMSRNKIERLDQRNYLGNLSVLIASHNEIEEIEDSFVDNVSNLTFIDIRHNKLKSLLPQFQKFSFKSVQFTENLLECTCDTIWLNDWVRRNSQNLSSELESRLICVADGRETRLLDVTWTSLVCYRDMAIAVSIALALLLVLIIVTTVILWRYKYELKVWMFKYLRVHPFDNAPCDDIDDATKLYDVYLSIDRENDDIRMWVKDRLLKRLELKTRSHPAYRVYYPTRQDDIGDSIADQMVENINKSRRVLAVVNSSYLHSGWSIEEFDHAHRLMEEARSGRLLVLVKGDLDLSNVTQEPLKTYLTQKQCLSLNDKWVWQKLRYELPHNPISNITSASRESLTSGISSIHATLSECSDISSYQPEDPDFVTTGVV